MFRDADGFAHANRHLLELADAALR